jgi:predicted ATPase
MLEQLRIQNFKGWQDTGDIQMAPITLFFGANSSGKSSIGQFLMMLKQTVESPDRKAVFFPGNRNSAVQLGSYTDIVFSHDPENKIEFSYRWQLKDSLKFRDPLSDNKTYTAHKLSFHATVALLDKTQHSPSVEEFLYVLHDHTSIQNAQTIGMKRSIAKSAEYEVVASNYDLIKQRGRPGTLKAPYRFYGFPDEVVAYHQNADFVKDLNLYHERLFRSLSYLGPLRTKAERLYSWTGIEPESVGYAGENTVAAILAARNRQINLVKPRASRASPAKPFEEIIALKLKEMGLIEEFNVSAISEQRQEYEVKVRAKGSRDWVDLPDVGFGISQVLPVLVQCFYAPPGSIIIMEQPEIHLHPSAQSALADVMIDVINSKEDGRDRDIQLIIETHSEHFLRRLQRRIAEDVIAQERVSAYFANVSSPPAKLEPLQIDMFGNIQNWPTNFFGDEMGDITGQAEAALKKRIKLRRQQKDAVNG